MEKHESVTLSKYYLLAVPPVVVDFEPARVQGKFYLEAKRRWCHERGSSQSERATSSLYWCALLDSNQGPPPCEGDALPLSQARPRMKLAACQTTWDDGRPRTTNRS
jgi:hypothetical protein